MWLTVLPFADSILTSFRSCPRCFFIPLSIYIYLFYMYLPKNEIFIKHLASVLLSIRGNRLHTATLSTKPLSQPREIQGRT
jgi:hypothetical protein